MPSLQCFHCREITVMAVALNYDSRILPRPWLPVSTRQSTPKSQTRLSLSGFQGWNSAVLEDNDINIPHLWQIRVWLASVQSLSFTQRQDLYRLYRLTRSGSPKQKTDRFPTSQLFVSDSGVDGPFVLGLPGILLGLKVETYAEAVSMCQEKRINPRS